MLWNLCRRLQDSPQDPNLYYQLKHEAINEMIRGGCKDKSSGVYSHGSREELDYRITYIDDVIRIEGGRFTKSSGSWLHDITLIGNKPKFVKLGWDTFDYRMKKFHPEDPQKFLDLIKNTDERNILRVCREIKDIISAKGRNKQYKYRHNGKTLNMGCDSYYHLAVDNERIIIS